MFAGFSEMSNIEKSSTVGSEEAEMTVLLLCNDQSKKSGVVNQVMGVEGLDFNEPESFLKFRVPKASMKTREMVLVVSPVLLLSKTTEKKTEMMESCVSRCRPSPHVFFLALQPETFTEQQQQRITSILQMFNEDSYHRTVILELSPSEKRSAWNQQNFHRMSEIIKKCQNRVLYEQNFKYSEMIKIFDQILEKNQGEPLRSNSGSKFASQQREEENSSSSSNTGYPLTIVLLEENEQSQHELFKLIHESPNFKPESKIVEGRKTDLLGQWRGTSLSLVRISNIFSMEREHVRRLLEERLIQCHSRPNLLLLLVQPSTFTEKNRHRLMFILGLFGKEAFQRSLVVTADGEEQTNMSLDRLLASCGGRCLYVVREDVGEFVEKMQSVIKENNGFLSLNKKRLSEKKNTALNLLLCGSSGRLKTLALQALSKQKELVPVVELPALFGQSQQIAMKDSLWCVSQFEPQGVHAFILVLPAGPLTDEDKQEIETLQKTFGPRLFELALIVFSVESNPIPADVLKSLRTNEEIQQLCERCGERADVFNLLDRNQIPELMDMGEELRCLRHSGYSLETFARFKNEKILQLENLIRELQSSENNSSGEEDSQSPQDLRIVLIGKTGNGKSSSGNTILGRQVFKSNPSPVSVTKRCEKVQGEVDGRPVFVVDTPGLFDSSHSHEEVYNELVKCMSLLAPGPHVFLLVLPIGRFTEEDEETLKLIRKGFGRNVEKFTIVLFTKGDNLKRDQWSIQDYIQKSNESFKELISNCRERFHVFNNCEEKNRAQVSELIKKIDDMVRENGGKCFTNEILQEAEAAIQKETERILKEKEEEMKREQQELERKYEIEIKEMKKRIEEKKTEINHKRNQREKQLKLMEDNIRMQEKKKEELEKKAKEEEDMRRAQEERERLAWEEKVKELEAKMKIDINEKETVEKELEKVRAEQMKAQDAWERERAEREKEKQEELSALQKLTKNFNLEKEKRESQAKEERRTEEEENQRKDLEEKHKKSMQQIKETHEEEARKQAEKFNEFQNKHKQELKDKEKEQAKEIQRVVRCFTKTKGNTTKIRELVKRQEKEIKSIKHPNSKTTLQSKHDEEITEMIKELMKNTVEDRCSIL